MLYDLWLLDVPKLLDLAALYGTGSPKLVHRLMQQVMGADSAPVLYHLLTWQLCMHSSWCTACCSMSAADFSSVPPVRLSAAYDCAVMISLYCSSQIEASSLQALTLHSYPAFMLLVLGADACPAAQQCAQLLA